MGGDASSTDANLAEVFFQRAYSWGLSNTMGTLGSSLDSLRSGV